MMRIQAVRRVTQERSPASSLLCSAFCVRELADRNAGHPDLARRAKGRLGVTPLA